MDDFVIQIKSPWQADSTNKVQMESFHKVNASRSEDYKRKMNMAQVEASAKTLILPR